MTNAEESIRSNLEAAEIEGELNIQPMVWIGATIISGNCIETVIRQYYLNTFCWFASFENECDSYRVAGVADSYEAAVLTIELALLQLEIRLEGMDE